MSDLISIERLRVNCIIGCLPEERKTPQDILVSVTLETDVSPAANADDLSLTIDYHALAQSITRFAQSHPFRLIETMAEKIAELCLEHPLVTAVTVRIEKPSAIPDAQCATVQIRRTTISKE